MTRYGLDGPVIESRDGDFFRTRLDRRLGSLSYLYRVFQKELYNFESLWKIYTEDMDFFLWGFDKAQVFVPPLPVNVVELRTRITAVVAKVTPEMLRSVWQETDYRWEVCRITNGSHIEP